MKISIITVTRNALSGLRRTAESVWMQKKADYEYLVIDGASDDGTQEWLEAHKDRLQYISEPDKGIYDAMNKGIQIAKGEWILLLNAEDRLVDENTLHQVEEHLPNHPALVYGDIYAQKQGTWQLRPAHKAQNCHRMFCCHQALFAPAKLLKTHPFVLHHPLSADLYWVKSMLAQGVPTQHIELPIVYYDNTGVSNTAVNRGLRDNIAVVRELDHGRKRLLFLLRLYYRIYWNMLRGKGK